MKLSLAEYKRVRKIRRTLLLMSFWDKIGSVVCWPWQFYKARQGVLAFELQRLVEKANAPEITQKVIDDFESFANNPFRRFGL